MIKIHASLSIFVIAVTLFAGCGKQSSDFASRKGFSQFRGSTQSDRPILPDNPEPGPTVTPSSTPTVEPSPSVAPSPTIVPGASPSPSPTVRPSPSPTVSPRPSPSPSPMAYTTEVREALKKSPNAPRSLATWELESPDDGFDDMSQDMDYLKTLFDFYQLSHDQPVFNHMVKIFLDYANTTEPTNNAVDNRLFPQFTSYYAELRDKISSSDRKVIDSFLIKLGKKIVSNKSFHYDEAHGKGNYNVMLRFSDVVGSIGIVENQKDMIDLIFKDSKYSLKVSWQNSIVDTRLKNLYKGDNPDCKACLNSKEGCTSDFCRRDSMGYHSRHVTHGIHLLTLAKEKANIDITQEKALLKKAIEFTVPYIEGKKSHKEFRYSQSSKDKKKDLYNKKYVFPASYVRTVKKFYPEFSNLPEPAGTD